MKVRYSARSNAQISAIHEYIREKNETAAAMVIARIRETARKLTRLPHLGHPTNEGNVRVIAVPRFPFVIFYKINKNVIVILNVRHTSQER
ncbi:type II toxin-antitoxin system RelE/ParE family toxin [Candidatus Kaiserbacteria bacterium]|nr:type II toxin-antitoxin system RelE/ParE family toxin [Candidatus Kaiserbacteria bacterium]